MVCYHAPSPPTAPAWGDEVLKLIRWEAAQLKRRLPAGYDTDDLESVGGEAATEAMARNDPGMDAGHAWNAMKLTVRNRMKSFIQSLKVAGRANARLPADEDGNELPVECHRTSAPDAIAERRESDRPILELGRALLANTDHGKVLEMFRRLQNRAASGDHEATKLLTHYLIEVHKAGAGAAGVPS